MVFGLREVQVFSVVVAGEHQSRMVQEVTTLSAQLPWLVLRGFAQVGQLRLAKVGLAKVGLAKVQKTRLNQS